MGDVAASGGSSQRFEARGHAAATRFIARAIEREHPPHALLLVGPRGVGKTTLALDLAAGLLCLDAEPSRRPCRACAACRKVASDNHPDLHLIEPEGAGEQIRIGQVQQLASELALTALEGRFRIAVLSAAHRLNPDAQNALLKTLEEPGAATCLVLCADDEAPLLPTVLSRSARLRLAPLRVDELAALLDEGGHAGHPQARAVAVAAAGRPGLAIALAQRPEAVLARSRVARTLVDLLEADRRTRLAAAGELIADGAEIDAAVRGVLPSTAKRLQPVERRRAVTTVIDIWRDLGRDLAVATEGAASTVHDLDLLEELRAAGERIDRGRLHRFLDRLDRLSLAVEGYANPELTLDALLLSWPRPTERAATERAA